MILSQRLFFIMRAIVNLKRQEVASESPGMGSRRVYDGPHDKKEALARKNKFKQNTEMPCLNYQCSLCHCLQGLKPFHDPLTRV